MRLEKFILLALFFLQPAMVKAEAISVQVKGMVCAFCAQGIEKKFKALPETASVNVSLETKKVQVDTKAEKDITDEKIKKIINDAGYDVVKIERSK